MMRYGNCFKLIDCLIWGFWEYGGWFSHMVCIMGGI